MLHVDFNPEQIDALHHERFHHPHPRVQLKMEAVYLKSQGLPHHEICRLARISENTLRTYLRQFQEGGVEHTVIDAMAVCALLRKLSARYAGLPVTLVLDNARSQKCEAVRLLAAALRIELLYLPAYAPNLNLIERLWRFVKKEVLSCRYYEDFTRFKAAIVGCLEGVEGEHKAAIASLLTLNFQTFEEPQILAA
jgi:transposase